MQLKAIVCRTSTKNRYAMHIVKLLLTYYLNITVQAANIYQIAESNRIEKNRFGSENRIESNRNIFARIGML